MPKVTINLSQGLIEAEGSEEFVNAQIRQFQDSMLPAVREIAGRITQTKKFLQTGDASIHIPVEGDKSELGHELSLRDIAAKMLVKTEPEWVLIYGYYIIASGKGSFTKDDIIQSYESSGRKNLSRLSNLQRSIKVASKNGWISILGEADYIVTPDGYEEVKKILSGAILKSGTTLKKSANHGTKRTSAVKKSTEAYEIVKDLDLHPVGQQSLVEFYKQKMPNNDVTATECILIFTYYLQKIAGLKGITAAHIYTCFREVGSIKIPIALKQNLINTAKRKGWIDVTSLENITVPTSGENYINHNLPKVASSSIKKR